MTKRPRLAANTTDEKPMVDVDIASIEPKQALVVGDGVVAAQDCNPLELIPV